jgi:hypothetical protein
MVSALPHVRPFQRRSPQRSATGTADEENILMHDPKVCFLSQEAQPQRGEVFVQVYFFLIFGFQWPLLRKKWFTPDI